MIILVAQAVWCTAVAALAVQTAVFSYKLRGSHERR